MTTPHEPKTTCVRFGYVAAFLLVFLIGAALRIVPTTGFHGSGPDEQFYVRYVRILQVTGLAGYPELFEAYIEHQKPAEAPLVLPPGRLSFIVGALAWQAVTSVDAMQAVRAVSCAGSILLLAISGVFAWRAAGRGFGLCVLGLMAAAPLEIHLAQRALVDGFFALWATAVVWTLWECLNHPRSRGWLAAYGCSIATMILTKENSAFVMAAALLLLLLNVPLRFGVATRELWAVTVIAPIFAACILVFAAGGADTLFDAYRSNVAKSYVSPYAIATGDGPWHRYLIDILTLSPVVFLCAVAGAARLRFSSKPALFLGCFTLATFALMCRLRYGMNLRYSNIWDFPMRWFAVAGVFSLAALAPARMRGLIIGGVVLLIAALELQQYYVVFVEHAVYDPVPMILQRALMILK